jgi:hypothetical protein
MRNVLARPLPGRPVGPVRDADIAVTDRLQDAVCAVVNGKDPDRPARGGRRRPVATFAEP